MPDPKPDLGLNELCRIAHENSKAHGWWDGVEARDPKVIPEKLMLIVSEASEALEDYRNGEMALRIEYSSGKPLGLPSEIADIVIRVADLCGHLGIDLADAVATKHLFSLKKLMLAAADQENFLRAEQLRRVLRGEPAAKPRGGAQLFYIQDLRTTVGNCASWWRPSGCGYTSELSEAGLYTAEEIKRRGLDGDHKPWPREVVERAMCRHVRVEHLREVGRCEGAI